MVSAPARNLTTPEEAGAVSSPRTGLTRWLAAGFVFLCFFPYPALRLGAHTGLQLNQALALLLVPPIMVLALRRASCPAPEALIRTAARRHLMAVYGLLLAALVASVVALMVTPTSHADLVYKAVGELALTTLVLVPGGWVAARGRLPWLLAPIAVALVVHSAVALYQLVQFRTYHFPFLGLYSNPSFAAVEEVAGSLAIPTGRPFGLFPEPSATMASIGPWLVLLTGMLTHQTLWRRQRGWHRRLLVTGFVAGSLLVVLSRSGDSLIIASCMVMASLGAATRRLGPGRSRSSRVKLVGGVLTMALLLAITTYLLAPRVAVESGPSSESWHARLASIQAALGLLGNGLRELFLGVGPGQTGPLIVAGHVNSFGTIWSISVRYLAECGLLGGAALTLVLTIAVRAIWRSAEPALGFACLLCWLAGVTVTSAYLALSPLWLFLGLLLIWDLVFGPRKPRPEAQPSGPEGAALAGRLGLNTAAGRPGAPADMPGG